MEIFKKRRERLLEAIGGGSDDILVLFSGFEFPWQRFRPSSSAYYLTGIKEPAVCSVIDMKGTMTAYFPVYGADRGLWCGGHTINDSWWNEVGYADVQPLGDSVNGYTLHVSFLSNEVSALLERLRKVVKRGGRILMAASVENDGEFNQFLWLSRLIHLEPKFINWFGDVSGSVADLRCVKDEDEIKTIKKAVRSTVEGQKAAAKAIVPGKTETEIRAEIEREFVVNGSLDPAFPSIVASGKNSTVLHHSCFDSTLNSGELVVVDVGAEFGFYAADLTRTYPVSGQFSERQKEVYYAVLEAQMAVEEACKPGMFLKDELNKPKSLHHIACETLSKYGLDKFFVHGVSHFFGLDVHDVGDVRNCLVPGCVLTIEPGVYIPEEGFGIRIEDNYLVTENGVERLSVDLPRGVGEIEEMISD
ncbi:aminopeptidase P N-terminal domain-containing protein [Candidatus Dependentiae bacterium]